MSNEQASFRVLQETIQRMNPLFLQGQPARFDLPRRATTNHNAHIPYQAPASPTRETLRPAVVVDGALHSAIYLYYLEAACVVSDKAFFVFLALHRSA